MDHIRFIESLLMIPSKGKLSEALELSPFSNKTSVASNPEQKRKILLTSACEA